MSLIGMDISKYGSRCEEALQASTSALERVGRRCWRARLGNSPELSLQARLEDGFLMLSTEYGEGLAVSSWELLEANSRLPGLLKVSAHSPADPPVQGSGLADRAVSLTPGLSQVGGSATLVETVSTVSAARPTLRACLRAEIPVDDETVLALRLEQTCKAWPQACQCLTPSPLMPLPSHQADQFAVPPLGGNGKKCGPSGLKAGLQAGLGEKVATELMTKSSTEFTTKLPDTEVPDLERLVEAAGWQSSSRRRQHRAVKLETSKGAYTALITAEAGAIRVRSELASWDDLPEPSRQAVATLLLDANSRLRFARAVIVNEQDFWAAHLEVLFQGSVSSAELRCALEALSAGTDLCAPVTEVLQNQTAAELFLALRGGPRRRENSARTNERTPVP